MRRFDLGTFSFYWITETDPDGNSAAITTKSNSTAVDTEGYSASDNGSVVAMDNGVANITTGAIEGKGASGNGLVVATENTTGNGALKALTEAEKLVLSDAFAQNALDEPEPVPVPVPSRNIVSL